MSKEVYIEAQNCFIYMQRKRGQTFVRQNGGETVLRHGESVFIRTSADERVCCHLQFIYFTRNFSFNQKYWRKFRMHVL